MNAYVERVLKSVKENNASMPEFIQTVQGGDHASAGIGTPRAGRAEADRAGEVDGAHFWFISRNLSSRARSRIVPVGR